MKLNTDCMIPIEEVNRDFSKAEGIVDSAGAAIVIKDNKPRYIILNFSELVSEQRDSKENIEDVADRILKNNHSSIEQLPVLQENDNVTRSITVEDILSLNNDYKTDDVFSLNRTIKEETIFNLDDTMIKNEEMKMNSGEEIKLNLESYPEDKPYLDEATKKTIEELKELLKG